MTHTIRLGHDGWSHDADRLEREQYDRRHPVDPLPPPQRLKVARPALKVTTAPTKAARPIAAPPAARQVAAAVPIAAAARPAVPRPIPAGGRLFRNGNGPMIRLLP